MALSLQQSLAGYVRGINLFPGSAPASVVFRNTLYVFYAGSGFDGVWCTSTTNGSSWDPIYNLNDKGAQSWFDNTGAIKLLSIAKGTSPAVVVYRDALWLFFTGSWGDGIYFTKFDGVTWTRIRMIDLGGRYTPPGDKTSPAAAVYRDRLYIFYSKDKVYWDFFDGAKWNGIDFLNGTFKGQTQTLGGAFSAPGTSPNAVVFDDSLYVFFNGIGNDGTWFSRLVGDSWTSSPTSVSSKLPHGMVFRPGTSPNTLVILENYSLRLYWVDNSTQTVSYADLRRISNQDRWTLSNRQLTCDGVIPTVAANTGLNSVQFLQTHYVFWSTGSGINFAPGYAHQLESRIMAAPAVFFRDSESFTAVTTDAALIKLLRTKLGNGSVDGKFTFAYPLNSDAIPNFIKSVYSDFDVTDGSLATRVSILTTLIASAFLFPYVTVLQLQPQKATLQFCFIG
jgi:hypothetical protein